MTTNKEGYSSDTLERSNLSSLQTDVASTRKSADANSNNNNLNQVHNCFCQQTFCNLKFVPCHVINANYDPAQACLCPRFQYNERDFQKQNNDVSSSKEWQRFNWKWPRQSFINKKDKAYDVTSRNKKHSRIDKPLRCCTPFEGIPQKKTCDFRTVLENPMKSEKTYKNAEKIEIYYFDHGNSAYYHTTDIPPILKSEKFAEKNQLAATRFWAEIFGGFHVGMSFVTTFFLQLLRFLLFSIVRPMTVGVIQMIADYFIKPLLSITFNGVIQPILILFYNVATSLRDCCEPLATALGFYMKEFAVLFRSCRLVEVTHRHDDT